MSHDLDAFLLSLYSGASTKTSALDAFSSADLGRIYGTPASHLEAAEKLAHDSACFLEQFEGTPLHGKAIALVGEELQIEAERIQRDEARRAQAEPVDDSWSKQRMIDLKKRQLELELHKIKSQHEASEAPEQEIAEHAEGVPAPMTSGGVPAKTAGLRSKLSSGELAALLKGRQAESWRNAASYLSPKDLLGKAVESGKTQAGGMSRSVASYAPARSAVRGMIDELRGSMPKTTASEVSGVRRLPTPEAARISRSVSDYLTKKASLGARVVAAAQRGAQQAATGMASRAAFPAVAKAPPTAPNAASFLAKKSPYMLKVPGSR